MLYTVFTHRLLKVFYVQVLGKVVKMGEKHSYYTYVTLRLIRIIENVTN